MIRFEEEIKKFKPSLEVDHIEEDVQGNQIEDLLDILRYVKTNDPEKSQQNIVDKE